MTEPLSLREALLRHLNITDETPYYHDREVGDIREAIDAALAAAPANDAGAIGLGLDEWRQRALRAEQFIGRITPDEWATIDKAKEAAALRAGSHEPEGLDVERLLRERKEAMEALATKHYYDGSGHKNNDPTCSYCRILAPYIEEVNAAYAKSGSEPPHDCVAAEMEIEHLTAQVAAFEAAPHRVGGDGNEEADSGTPPTD